MQRARELRQKQTTAEDRLWNFLRGRQIEGRKFRRQHPLGTFIADFYCDDARLVIEVDGAIDDEPTQSLRDDRRTEILRNYHLEVLRFSNEQIMADIWVVLGKIKACILEHSYENR